MKVGLFGGTFNPVHLAHLRMAEEVREAFALDKIYFIPAASPPHKTDLGLAPAPDRYAMLKQAAAANPGFEVSDVEMRRGGPSYTIDTVEQIFSLLPAGSRCCLIMGLDAFLEIDTWKAFSRLFDRLEVIVVSRPSSGAGRQYPAGPPEEMADVIFHRISGKYRYEAQTGRFVHPQKQAVCWFPASALDISATRIRELVAGHKSIRYLVPGAVETYIYQKGLYI